MRKEITNNEELKVSIGISEIEAEVDEQWSFVGKKSNPRWLWYAIDHKTNKNPTPEG